MSFLYQALKPLLFTQDPESIHHLVASLAKTSLLIPGVSSLLSSTYTVSDQKLKTSIAGITLRNPVGLAAGFDKNGYLPRFFSNIGFGFAEIGSVTSQISEGNPKPRMFRLPEDKALINRLGLNNEGAQKISERLSSISGDSDFVYAVNIAKTNSATLIGEAAEADIVDCYRVMKDRGGFHILNISCPNTEDGKTFEEPKALESLLKKIRAISSSKPLLIKFSPDLENELLLEDLKICEAFDIDGYVLSNTSSQRIGLQTDSQLISGIGRGGVSGAPLFERMIERVAFVRKRVGSSKSIIAVGGIDSAEKAFRAITHGANAIELYTGLIYEGPGVAKSINQGLLKILEQKNFKSISEVVGSEVA